jgi:hypothetical protein
MDLSLLVEWASLVQSIATTAAIVIGGVWAYYRFFKDRTYWPRLELSVTARATRVGDIPAFLFTTSVHNVGLSRVDVRPRGTALLIESAKPPTRPHRAEEPLNWQAFVALEVLAHHGWVEAGERIVEDHVVLEEGASRPLRATFRIVQDAKTPKEWSAMVIAARQVESLRDARGGGTVAGTDGASKVDTEPPAMTDPQRAQGSSEEEDKGDRSASSLSVP